ncbi:MAG: ABC transporter substrate-binding protein [Propionibacteriaceae bacterium]|nr:ABC transporter substrate-binding protein [Propionibacteriaceae bacterium]
MNRWWRPPRPVRALGAVLAAGALVVGAACTQPTESGHSPHPLTVGTFGRVTTTDPAAATDTGSTIYVLNVFQRLLTTEAGTGVLKPDAASDCWFIDEVTYSCGLRKDMTFINGNPVTASDVKFSIERAMDLDVPGSSARQLDNVEDMIVTEDDPYRIDFKLAQHDRAFGYALASPAASIVDEDTYPDDELWPQGQQPVSSGPFYAEVATLDELQLNRYSGYRGRHGGRLPAVTLKTYSTPEALDRAVATGTIDVLWRVPVQRVPGDGDFQRQVLAGATVQRLLWNPESPRREDAAVRDWVRDATTPLRTLASPVPQGAGFAADTFAVGGDKPTAPDGLSGEITLGYDTRLPGQADLAARVRDAVRPELGVRLVGDDPDADVRLTMGQAWTNTEMAWLQPYVEFPLPGREAEVRELELAFRASEKLPEAERAARELQEAVARDATVVPLIQSDEEFWIAPGVALPEDDPGWLGPTYQLAAWGFGRE